MVRHKSTRAAWLDRTMAIMEIRLDFKLVWLEQICSFTNWAKLIECIIRNVNSSLPAVIQFSCDGR